MKSSINIYDYIGGESITAAGISFLLEQIDKEETEEVEVHINSSGGELFEGLAIFNLLRNFSQNTIPVNTVVDGIAGSIASVIALAGEKVSIHKNAYLFVHNPWSLSLGDVNDAQKTAEDLGKFRDTLIEIYKSKTGKNEEELKTLLDRETFLNSAEALELGFVDKVIENYPAKNYVALFSNIGKEEHRKTLSDELIIKAVDELKSNIKDLTEKIENKVEEVQSLRASLQKEETEKILSGIENSKVLPAIKKPLNEIVKLFSSSEERTNSFNHLQQYVFEILSNIPEHNLEDEFRNQDTNNTSFEVEPGFSVDGAQLEVYNRAKKLVKEKEISFFDAIKELQKNKEL